LACSTPFRVGKVCSENVAKRDDGQCKVLRLSPYRRLSLREKFPVMTIAFRGAKSDYKATDEDVRISSFPSFPSVPFFRGSLQRILATAGSDNPPRLVDARNVEPVLEVIEIQDPTVGLSNNKHVLVS
jgi:hypothetical protein